MKRNSIYLIAILCAAAQGACQKSNDKQLKALADRVDKLETDSKKFAEVDEFVRPIMTQQKTEREQQEANEPDPNVRFAVSIAGDPSVGSATAAVTIIEAFDFA